MKPLFLICFLFMMVPVFSQTNLHDAQLKVTEDSVGQQHLKVLLDCNALNTASGIDITIGTTTTGADISNASYTIGGNGVQMTGNDLGQVSIAVVSYHENYFGHVVVHLPGGDEEIYLVNTGN